MDKKESGFIVHGDDHLDDGRYEMHHSQRRLPSSERELDVERDLRKKDGDFDNEETTQLDQQALIPFSKDPKLWMVGCETGHEREVVAYLTQKANDKGSELQITSVIALDHHKNYIYVEAHKEAHVKEAIKGVCYILQSKLMLVPLKEMTDVLSVKSKAVDISKNMWVRLKVGTYKGDLAKVVDVDSVKRSVTVKLIPRIDLQVLANKVVGGREVEKKKVIPPQRFITMQNARDLHLDVTRSGDQITGDDFYHVKGMTFQDGFLLKTYSTKSITTQNIHPTFEELEMFWNPKDADGDSAMFGNREKGHFMEGETSSHKDALPEVVRGAIKKQSEITAVSMVSSTENTPLLAGFRILKSLPTLNGAGKSNFSKEVSCPQDVEKVVMESRLKLQAQVDMETFEELGLYLRKEEEHKWNRKEKSIFDDEIAVYVEKLRRIWLAESKKNKKEEVQQEEEDEIDKCINEYRIFMKDEKEKENAQREEEKGKTDSEIQDLRERRKMAEVCDWDMGQKEKRTKALRERDGQKWLEVTFVDFVQRKLKNKSKVELLRYFYNVYVPRLQGLENWNQICHPMLVIDQSEINLPLEYRLNL